MHPMRGINLTKILRRKNFKRAAEEIALPTVLLKTFANSLFAWVFFSPAPTNCLWVSECEQIKNIDVKNFLVF